MIERLPIGIVVNGTRREVFVEPRRTLAEFRLPPGVYAAGRLDLDSEGLLLLSDEGALVHRLGAWRLVAWVERHDGEDHEEQQDAERGADRGQPPEARLDLVTAPHGARA